MIRAPNSTSIFRFNDFMFLITGCKPTLSPILVESFRSSCNKNVYFSSQFYFYAC